MSALPQCNKYTFSKEDVLRKYEDSGKVCEWSSYQKLLRRFEQASLKKDIKRMAELKGEIHNICQICGAFPTPEIMRILEDVTLSENNVNYIRNSLNFIERCCEQQDFRTIHTLVGDINKISGCNCQPCEPKERDFATAMRRGFSSIQGAVRSFNFEEQAREQNYPETCTDKCTHLTCPYRRQENFNKPCLQQFKPLRRTLDPNFQE